MVLRALLAMERRGSHEQVTEAGHIGDQVANYSCHGIVWGTCQG